MIPDGKFILERINSSGVLPVKINYNHVIHAMRRVKKSPGGRVVEEKKASMGHPAMPTPAPAQPTTITLNYNTYQEAVDLLSAAVTLLKQGRKHA